MNDPNALPDERPHRLMNVANRATASISQHIVAEVDAIVAELVALRLPIDEDAMRNLSLDQETNRACVELSWLSHTAAQAGFAVADENRLLPPRVRVPREEIARQLNALVTTVEDIHPMLERIAQAQSLATAADPKQQALVSHVIDKANIKVELIFFKIWRINLIDVSGLVLLARQLGDILRSFAASVAAGSARLLTWLLGGIPTWRKSAQTLMQRAAELADKAASADLASSFDPLDVERIIIIGMEVYRLSDGFRLSPPSVSKTRIKIRSIPSPK